MRPLQHVGFVYTAARDGYIAADMHCGRSIRSVHALPFVAQIALACISVSPGLRRMARSWQLCHSGQLYFLPANGARGQSTLPVSVTLLA